MSVVEEHYSREDVKLEILEFSRGRWLALAGAGWVRYSGQKPLKSDSIELPKTLLETGTRSLYATTSIYSKLETRGDAFDDSKVVAVTPFLDVDNELEQWRATVEVSRLIVDELESLGVVKSVYLLWSGKGMHVRVNENSLSPELRDLDHAWALAEHLRMRIEERVFEIRRKYDATHLKVENQLKPRSLFTVPLSLHRKLDRVAICMSPEGLDDFDPSWTLPGSFRHEPSWRSWELGESDGAAEVAIKLLGGYPGPRRVRRRKEPPVDEMIRKWIDD